MNPFSKEFQVVGGLKKDDIEKNVSRDKWNYYTLNKEVSVVPSHIDLEITNACNMNCIMCERKYMNRKVGFMDVHLYKDIIHQCVDLGIMSLKLNLWGESFLHPQFVQMIKIAKEAGIERTQFNTVGLLLDKGMIQEICLAGLDRITISVDGTNKETYQSIRKNSDYDKVISNLNELIKYKRDNNCKKPLITLQIIRMKDTENEIDNFLSNWCDKVDFVTVTNVNTVLGLEEVMNLSLKDSENKVQDACSQLWQRMSILWDGTVTVCCSDLNGDLAIGNIKNKSISSLWHSDKLNALREKHMNKDLGSILCRTCDGRFG